MNCDTIFPVASLTKPIIATLLLSLQEDGELDLVDPIKNYLPELACSTIGERTLLQFITHSSGVVDEELGNIAVEFMKNELKLDIPEDGSERDTREVWDEIMQQAGKLLDVPTDKVWEHIILKNAKDIKDAGSLMSYCNTGYNQLKNVVVAVGKKSIDEIARQRIFDPLGMVDTHFVTPEEKWDRIIRRPEGSEGFPFQNSEQCFKSDYGAGGLKTTPNDYLQFCEMIRKGGTHNNARVLSRLTVDAIMYDYNFQLSQKNPFDAWALGFNIRGKKCDDTGIIRPESCLDHGGWGGTKIIVDPQNHISMVIFGVLTNGKPLLSSNILNITYSALI